MIDVVGLVLVAAVNAVLAIRPNFMRLRIVHAGLSLASVAALLWIRHGRHV